MNRRRIAVGVVLLLATCVASGCATFKQHAITQGEWIRSQDLGTTQFKRVAVLGLENDPLFQQSLTIAYLNKGVDVVEREKIDAILKEGTVAKNWADLSDQEKAKTLGRLLKVDALVLGGVMHDRYWAIDRKQAKRMGYTMPTGESLASPFPGAQVYAEYGTTWRVIDVASGQISCVGDRILSVRREVKAKDINSMSPLELIRLLCKNVVEDSLSDKSGVRDAELTF